MKKYDTVAIVIFLIGFLILVSTLEKGTPESIVAAFIFFLFTTGGALMSLSYSKETKEMVEKETDPLSFIITYISPMTKREKNVMYYDQEKMRKLLEKLVKKNIKYTIKVNYDNAKKTS